MTAAGNGMSRVRPPLTTPPRNPHVASRCRIRKVATDSRRMPEYRRMRKMARSRGRCRRLAASTNASINAPLGTCAGGSDRCGGRSIFATGLVVRIARLTSQAHKLETKACLVLIVLRARSFAAMSSIHCCKVSTVRSVTRAFRPTRCRTNRRNRSSTQCVAPTPPFVRPRVKGGVGATHWVLERFLRFVRHRVGRNARVTDLTVETLQQWMDDMAANDLALSTMRTRQALVSSLCAWLVKRAILTTNPVAKMDRPPHRSEPPAQVPSGALMDALVEAARRRQRPRDLAIFLILRYSGMRRESVATLRIRHLDATWGLRGGVVKGGRTRDIPLPAAVMQFLWAYVEQVMSHQGAALDADTPLFWSSWGRRGRGKARQPMTGKNIWRL